MLFPSNIGFSAIEPVSHDPAYISESQSLKTIAVSTGAQRWEGTLTTGILNEADFRRAWSFLNGAGQGKSFDIPMPLLSKPLGVVSGTVQALTGYSKGDSEISFSNYLPEHGDFIRFVGHSKNYQILDKAGSSATIHPPLFKPVSLGEIVSVVDVLFKVRRIGKLSKLKVSSKNKTAKIKFNVEEAF